MSDEPDDPDLRHPERAVPPRSEEIERARAGGERALLHCLSCGGQLAALRHGGSCLYCGSSAVVVEE